MLRNRTWAAHRLLCLERLEDRCVPAADWLNGIGAIGDSLTNEYLGIASRSSASSWVQLLADQGGANFGTFNSNWGSPRGTGYEYNWGLGAASSADVIANGLHTKLAAQIAAGGVSLAVLQTAHTDLIHAPGQPLARYQAIYNGTLAGADLSALIDQAVANTTAALDTLTSAGNGNARLVLMNSADLNSTPLFTTVLGYTDPAGRQRFHDAVAQFNARIGEAAAQRGIPVVDLFTYSNQILQGEQWVVGDVPLNMTAFVNNQSNPTHLFEDDGHPGTIGQGLLANAVIAAANRAYGAGLAPLSDQAILAAAGLTPTTSGPTYFDISSFVIDPPSRAGVLDRAFGSAGKVVTDIAGLPTGEQGRSVAVQADGKILVAGGVAGAQGSWSDNSSFLLVRYRADGSLDTTFGNGGRVTTDFLSLGSDGVSDEAEAIALQPDGKILVAGHADFEFGGGIRKRLVMARYTSAGVLDTSFGDNGKVAFSLPGQTLRPTAVIAVQSDGKIVLGGSYESAADYSAVLVRYTSSGTLDNTFGTGGRVVQAFGFGSGFDASALAVQASDGKIVVGGGEVLARFSSTGALDTTFDGDGWARISDMQISSLMLQGDKIVVAGQSNGDFALARYTSIGGRDTTFSGGGLVTTDFGGYDQANGLAAQPDGRIVVVGVASQGGDQDFALARYTADGGLDTAFGNGGKLLTDFGGYDVASAVAVLPNGRIVAVGTAAVEDYSSDLALAGYTSLGVLDTGFSDDGKVLTGFLGPAFNGVQAAVVTQPDGKVVVAGIADDRFALLRYNPDGSLDPAFGTGGVALSDFAFYGIQAGSAAIQADGKILVAGRAYQDETGYDFVLMRFTGGGSIDTAFGTNGVVLTDFGTPLNPGGEDYAYAVAVQADGKILVSGSVYSSVTESYDFAVARYDSGGTLDTTFGVGGRATIDFGSGRDIVYAPGMVVQPDGKIALAGASDQGATGWDFVVARLNANGNLDTSFDTDGKLTLDLGTPDDGAGGVALQPDGKIVLGGWSWNDGGFYEMAVVRLHGNGSLDLGFDSDGWRILDFGPGDAWANAVAIQADGKIVVAGPATPGSTAFDFALARLNGDGSPDTAFGIGGAATTSFGPGDDEPFGLALQPDGGIVVAGITHRPLGTTDFALARYHGAANTDTDGVSDSVEDGAPNNGDGDNDGEKDRLQANVASLPSATPEARYVTLKSQEGTALTAVTALPAPGAAPAGAQFPVGAFSFTVTGPAAGAAVEVVLYMPVGAVVNAYYKQNATTGAWVLFEGATFEDRNNDGTADVVLALTDGGDGDADGLANGLIDDPGAPAYVPPPLRVQIDVRPESLNLASQGVVPVVFFGSAALGVSQVNVASILFAGAAAQSWSYADVNGDGQLDLVLHFRTQDTDLKELYQQLLADDKNADGTLDSTRQVAEVRLTGETLSDELFEGYDSLSLFLSGKALRGLLDQMHSNGLL